VTEQNDCNTACLRRNSWGAVFLLTRRILRWTSEREQPFVPSASASWSSRCSACWPLIFLGAAVSLRVPCAEDPWYSHFQLRSAHLKDSTALVSNAS